MKARDVERLLVENGVAAAKMDAVTRQLRQANRLPTGGRGPNAPDIGPLEAAIVLIAVAGSGKGSEANARLQKLEHLTCSFDGRGDLTLLEALTDVLNDPRAFPAITEIRIGRTARHAVMVHSDAAKSYFYPDGRRSMPQKFYVEGILPGRLIQTITKALRAKTLRGAQSA